MMFLPSSPSISPISRPATIKYSTRRTVQVDSDEVAEPETAGPNAWMCPHCAHRQANKHLPDLRRHILTHYPNARVYVCRGKRVPEAYVAHHGVAGLKDYFVDEEGAVFAGGCGKAFSRKDALTRHLRNPNNETCKHDLLKGKRRSGGQGKAASKHESRS